MQSATKPAKLVAECNQRKAGCTEAMPSLTIRDIPEDLMSQVRATAAAENRSVNAQVIYWLGKAAQDHGSAEPRSALFERIRSRREALRTAGTSTDSVSVIRQLREERDPKQSKIARSPGR